MLAVSTALAAGRARAADSRPTLDLFAPAATSRTILRGRRPSAAETFAVLRPEALASARTLGRASILLPTPDGSMTLDLERDVELLPDATVTTTDDAGPHPFTADVVTFRGRVTGDSASRAVVSIGSAGVMGFVETHRRHYSVAPVGGGLHRVLDESRSPSAVAPPRCDVDETQILNPSASRLPPAASVENAASGVHKVCHLAVDCDYAFYAGIFQGDGNAAVQYATTLLEYVSLIYERDVGVAIRVGYLNVWTTPGGPYTSTDSQTLLDQFRSYWNANEQIVPRTIAILLTGLLAGGRAYINVLCDDPTTGFGYGVVGNTGKDQFSSNLSSTDVYLTAHEIGHEFGAYHTQSCMYGTLGYCDANALLDSCVTGEGTCYTGPVGILPPDKGTIMSYCNQLPGGASSNIRLVFHPASASLMRNSVDIRRCLDVPAAQPPTDLAATGIGASAHLTWTPSISTGVLRYLVYRSRQQTDPATRLAGTTTDSVYDDPVPWGTFYYRVRAVRASDVSDASAECSFSRCPMIVTTRIPAGPDPRNVVAADFNGDGLPDLAVTQGTTGQVAVFLAEGAGGTWSGSYSSPVLYAAGGGAAGIITTDFDGDGITDLAVTDTNDGAVSILPGHGAAGVGDGTFGPPRKFPVGPGPTALDVADLNDDGILDLAVLNRTASTMTPLFGHGANGIGDGSFAAGPFLQVPGSGTMDLFTTDFNADGITDVGVLRFNGLLTVSGLGMDGRASGTFQPASQFPAPVSDCYAMAGGDFNADGILDVVVVGNDLYVAQPRLFVFLGTGTGSVPDGGFAAPVAYPTATFVQSVAVADLTGDGIPDVAVGTNDVTNEVLIYPGVGDGGLAAPMIVNTGSPVRSLRAADVDGDGVVDLIAVCGSPGSLAVIRTDCDRELPNAATVLAPNGGEQWAVGSEQVITWARDPGCGAVDLERSSDGGRTWEPIARRQVGTSFRWTVPGPASARCRIRVSNSSVSSAADTSDADFTIEAPAPPPPPPGGNAVTRLAIRSISPNPVRTDLAADLSLPSPDPFTLELVDISGRRVRADRLVPSQSEMRVQWTGLRLRPGLYMLRLEQDGVRVFAKIAVLG